MRPGDKDIDQEARRAERFAEGIHRDECRVVMERFANKLRNKHQPAGGPSIGVAKAAEYFYLDAYCPGCRQVKQIDLRKIDRHPGTDIMRLIPSLSCRTCQPSPPFAKLVGVSRYEWYSDNVPWSRLRMTDRKGGIT